MYKLWSCKEAYLKLLGTGLSYNLKEIEISEDFRSVHHPKYDTKEIILNPIYQKEKNYIANVTHRGKRIYRYLDF
jgi:phosphopantetheinyl transferase